MPRLASIGPTDYLLSISNPFYSPCWQISHATFSLFWRRHVCYKYTRKPTLPLHTFQLRPEHFIKLNLKTYRTILIDLDRVSNPDNLSQFVPLLFQLCSNCGETSTLLPRTPIWVAHLPGMTPAALAEKSTTLSTWYASLSKTASF